MVNTKLGHRMKTVLGVLVLSSAAGCGSAPQPPSQATANKPPANQAASKPETPTTTAPSTAATPAPIDTAKIQATLTPDQTLEVVTLEGNAPKTVSGTVDGYKSKVWAVSVAKGQTLTVTFKPSNTSLYMNVVDASDTSGVAVHRGEADGPDAKITASKDAVYLIEPFQPRATARRNEKGDYTITIGRS